MIERVGVCAAALLSLLIPQQPPQATFRTGVAAVALDVSVRDRGRIITGLKAADFKLLDDGDAQEIIDVSFDKLPIDVTVALDVSASVTGNTLDRLQEAVARLMGDLGPKDRLRLMTFHARVSRVTDFTSDANAISRAIKSVRPGGGTSIFDAITTAVVSADQADRRQLLLVFTDGADSTSITEPRALSAVLSHANVAVSTVMPATVMTMTSETGTLTRVPGTNTTIMVPPIGTATQTSGRSAVFQRLAQETGGQAIAFRSVTDLGTTFNRVLDAFRSSYVLRFVPKAGQRRGFHPLIVTVAGRDGLTINARRGYWID